MRRRPDATTRWLLKDQQSSGLTLGEYELLHGIVFEELPLPSPATQRIRRHERSLDMDAGPIKPRPKAQPATKTQVAPRGTMTPEMAEARRAFYAAEKMMSPLTFTCVTCGDSVPSHPDDQRVVCASCRRQLIDLGDGRPS